MRCVPEIGQPAIIEFGGLELVFLRHLPKLVRHFFVAGEVCIPSAQRGGRTIG
jgi:hypothetical protein